jgi:hypothetical protein
LEGQWIARRVRPQEDGRAAVPRRTER